VVPLEILQPGVRDLVAKLKRFVTKVNTGFGCRRLRPIRGPKRAPRRYFVAAPSMPRRLHAPRHRGRAILDGCAHHGRPTRSAQLKFMTKQRHEVNVGLVRDIVAIGMLTC
jgi:hypothetical protein